MKSIIWYTRAVLMILLSCHAALAGTGEVVAATQPVGTATYMMIRLCGDIGSDISAQVVDVMLASAEKRQINFAIILFDSTGASPESQSEFIGVIGNHTKVTTIAFVKRAEGGSMAIAATCKKIVMYAGADAATLPEGIPVAKNMSELRLALGVKEWTEVVEQVKSVVIPPLTAEERAALNARVAQIKEEEAKAKAQEEQTKEVAREPIRREIAIVVDRYNKAVSEVNKAASKLADAKVAYDRDMQIAMNDYRQACRLATSDRARTDIELNYSNRQAEIRRTFDPIQAEYNAIYSASRYQIESDQRTLYGLNDTLNRRLK